MSMLAHYLKAVPYNEGQKRHMKRWFDGSWKKDRTSMREGFVRSNTLEAALSFRHSDVVENALETRSETSVDREKSSNLLPPGLSR